MAPRRSLWLLTLPLAAVGWFAAHSLAYLLVEPAAAHRDELLAGTGHSYLPEASAVVACGLTLVLAGFALAVHDGMRRRAPGRAPVRPLLLLPPAGFAVQEHLERLIETNALPLAAALEPSFAVGMALQLAFAALAVLAARAVLGFAHALGRGLAVAAAPRAPARECSGPARGRPAAAPPPRPVPYRSRRERAPPRPAAV